MLCKNFLPDSSFDSNISAERLHFPRARWSRSSSGGLQSDGFENERDRCRQGLQRSHGRRPTDVRLYTGGDRNIKIVVVAPCYAVLPIIIQR